MAAAGEMVRAARERAGISQRRLALRAGTSQDAISRIERGIEAPTIERLRKLLLALGEELRIGSVAAAGETPAAARNMSPAERLRESASWNRVATRLELAGAEARARRPEASEASAQRDG